MYEKLERKFGKYAIKNLMKYVIMLYICGFIIYFISSAKNVDLYYTYLCFDVKKILSGQVWRILSWMLEPIDSGIFFFLISIYFYYLIGSTLERYWGSFRFNLFYFSGVFFNILASVLFYIISGPLFGVNISYPITLQYINLSMFFAFATLFSDTQILLFFILPIKIKYLAYIYAIVEFYQIAEYYIKGSWQLGVAATLVCVISLLNFLIYFFNAKKYGVSKLKQRARSKSFQRAYEGGLRENVYRNAEGQNVPKKVVTRHKCAVCGRTELDDPELEFRFCSKCDGNYEYCMDHLYTHTHVVRGIKLDGSDQDKSL